MVIAASKVKAVCTASEAALVRASRSPELEKLSQARVKQMATRSRKLANKWRDLGRGQSRASNRSVGSAKEDTNTKLKEQIFREALAAFEGRLGKPDSASAKKGFRSSPKPTKKHRAAEHRARRAAVRKGMTVATDLENAVTLAEEPAPKAPVAASEASSSPAPAAKPGKTSRPTAAAARVVVTPPRPAKAQLAPPATQRQAVIAAKKSRIARSGKTTRVLAHVKSRGKRVQARRDAKG